MVNLPHPMPTVIAALPTNKVGFPVPWFVGKVDGEYDFRVIRAGAIETAISHGVCWVCGQPRAGIDAFLIGPMCAVNRVSAEPPSHLHCARWSAKACPFLTRPAMVRRETGIPEDAKGNVAGTMIRRNPGVALVWAVRASKWYPFTAPGGSGILFDVGEPEACEWYAEGREATRAEVDASIESGLPILMAEAEAEGPDAVDALNRMHADALSLLPEAA